MSYAQFKQIYTALKIAERALCPATTPLGRADYAVIRDAREEMEKIQATMGEKK